MSAPVQLDRDARALLNSVKFFEGAFIPLQPHDNRIGQRLEAMGLVMLRACEVKLGGFVLPYTAAAITEAGRRLLEGPRLVTLDGGWVDARGRPTIYPPWFDPALPRDHHGNPLAAGINPGSPDGDLSA